MRQRTLPTLPSMMEGRGAEVCVSLLHLDKAGGWTATIGHGEKIKWFDRNHAMFFADGGPL